MIYERHADYSLAYRMCGRRGLAEDVTQEAFLAPPEPFIER
jgi:DNA-directed RNA polymerase specialized sigma24 family protein